MLHVHSTCDNVKSASALITDLILYLEYNGSFVRQFTAAKCSVSCHVLGTEPRFLFLALIMEMWGIFVFDTLSIFTMLRLQSSTAVLIIIVLRE